MNVDKNISDEENYSIVYPNTKTNHHIEEEPFISDNGDIEVIAERNRGNKGIQTSAIKDLTPTGN